MGDNDDGEGDSSHTNPCDDDRGSGSASGRGSEDVRFGYGTDGIEPVSLSTLLSDVLADRATAVHMDRSDAARRGEGEGGKVDVCHLAAASGEGNSYTLPVPAILQTQTYTDAHVDPPSLDEVVRCVSTSHDGVYIYMYLCSMYL